MKDCFIVDAVRSPIGKQGGSLSTIRADDLLAQVIKGLLKRHSQLDYSFIEDVIIGAGNQAGEDCRNIARMSALLSDLPFSVPGNTVNRLCGSGMQAIMDATRAIQCGEGILYIAGGVDNMSRSPLVKNRNASEGDKWIDSTIGWRFTNPELAMKYTPYSMGETAELVATKCKISRDQQDEFAFNSHQKYFQAFENKIWESEIVPININKDDNPYYFQVDENPRKISLERLATLKPVFYKAGSVTAGNASGINDGASALLLANEEAIKRFELQPIARVVNMAVTGVHPSLMGLGSVSSTKKALIRANLSIKDMDIIELNESFASTTIACLQELHIQSSIVNVNGGTLALGNPIGSNGARIVTTLIHQMLRQKITNYGMASTCVGLGQGMTIILEKV